MKTRNFPSRVALRRARAKLRRGETLSSLEDKLLSDPTVSDTRFRIGREERHLQSWSGTPTRIVSEGEKSS